MKKPLLLGLICEIALSACALAVLIVSAVIGAVGPAIFAGVVVIALLYIAGGFIMEHFRPGCHYFDWVEWFITVFCVDWIWNTFCKSWIFETFCKKWVWQKFCINTVYRRIEKYKTLGFISAIAFGVLVVTLVLIFITAKLASSRIFFWVSVYAVCVICLALDGLLVRKGDTRLDRAPRVSVDQRFVCLFAVSVLAIIAGIRNIGGTDYNIYRAIYNNAPSLGDYFKYYKDLDHHYVTYGVERAYIFANSFFKTLHFSYYGYIFVQALFIVFTTYFALRRYTDEFMLVIMVFLYKFYFYNVFISLRQPITIAIFFIMLKFMNSKRIVPYMLLCVLAFSFHTAAIVLFPLYFLNRVKLSRKLVIALNIIFLPTLVLSAMKVPVLKIFEPLLNLEIFATDEIFMKTENLLLGESLNAINWLHTAEYFVLMIFLIYFFNQICESHPESDTMIKLFLCLLPIFTLCRNYELLTRIKDYFTISYGFIIAYIASIQKGKYRFMAYTLASLWCAFGFLRFIILFDGGAMLRYVPNIFLGRGMFE